jgi:hypothetical protein
MEEKMALQYEKLSKQIFELTVQKSDSDSESFKNSIVMEKLELAKSRSRREEEMLQIRKDEA